MGEELNKCKCGGKAIFFQSRFNKDNCGVKCSDCNKIIKWFSRDDAINRWITVNKCEHAQNADDYHKHKHDKGKTDWGMIPEVCFRALIEKKSTYAKMFHTRIELFGISFDTALYRVFAILEHGKEVYGRESWKTLEDAQQRYFASYMRHTFNKETGRMFPSDHIDDDSGLPSVDHALCNILFLLWFEVKDYE